MAIREGRPTMSPGRWQAGPRTESPYPDLPLQWNKWPTWFSTRVIITSSRWLRRKHSE